MAINSPRGTSDIFGDEIFYRDCIVDSAKKLFELFNYTRIITPAFEHTEIFNRGIGKSTDIVKKEMYTFPDRKGRSLTLRPEGTAPVVRAIIEHKLYSSKIPIKLFYIENMFRYERPQKGRMREFWQLGVEAAGVDNPLIDAEVIWLLALIFEELGFKNLKLLINSVGCENCRPQYIGVFKDYLKPYLESLCPDCRERYNTNPLRIFDCKIPSCIKIINNSPKIYSHICGRCSSHFKKVIELLKILNIPFVIKEELVRGFDYYTRTIFEIISEDLDSVQNALGGGGRYDKLIEQFGGPSIPSIGFAVGIDRTIVLMKQLGISWQIKKEPHNVFIILLEERFENYGLEFLNYLRRSSIKCDISFEIKKISTQIKWAEKNGFSHAAIIGEDELKSDNITVKNLADFKQSQFNWKKEPQKIYEILK
ncbi:MAG: histidine--tRNA ligase [Actinobacteria bacterium]|nr:histidine--tRNA ligase [Actinomycetota bacterium]